MLIEPVSIDHASGRIASVIIKELENVTRVETGLEPTDERLIPGKIARTVWMQHTGRYYFAAPFVVGKTVLDCACGVGYGTHILGINGAKMALGVDQCDKAVLFAEKNYRASNINYKVMNAESLSFGESSFDIVVSFETMEHLKNPEKFLGYVLEYLKPEGTLIISVPNKDALPDHVDTFSPFHEKEYSLPEFRELLSRFFDEATFYSQRWHDQEQMYRKRFLDQLRKLGLGSLRAYVPGFAKKLIFKTVIDSKASRENDELNQSDFEPRPLLDGRPLGEDDSVLLAICRAPKKHAN